MQKRRLYLLLIGVGVVAALIAFMLRSREPEYGGKRLSDWVMMFPAFGLPGDAKQAEEGIRHIGTNAVPYLLKWIRYERPPWKTKLYAFVNRTAARLKLTFRLTDISEEWRAFGSMRAFVALGPESHGAVRELTKVMCDARTTMSANRALTVLDVLVMQTTDRRVVPDLKEMLKDPNPKVRAFAAHGLGHVERQAPERPTP